MKTKICGTVLLALLIALVAPGCMTTKKGPDGSTSAGPLFDVYTNVVTVVKTVTNIIPVMTTNVQTVTVTNQITETEVEIKTLTNIVTAIQWEPKTVLVTNQVEVTQVKPSATADAIAGAGGLAGGFFGVGGLATTLLAGLFGGWAKWQNRKLVAEATGLAEKNTGLTVAAQVLVDNIEVLRNVLATTPQGQKLSLAVKEYLMKNQSQANAISVISELLKDVVDPESAALAAQKIAAKATVS